MDPLFTGNIQVVEADIEPIIAHEKLTDEEYDWKPKGNMISQSPGNKPLHNEGIDRHYGTTTSGSPTNKSLSHKQGSRKLPGGIARYDSRNNGSNSDGDVVDDDDAILVFGGSDQLGEQDGIPAREVRDHERIEGEDGIVGDAIVTAVGNAGSEHIKIVHSHADDRLRCGWFGYSPPFAQIFNNRKGYLLFLCMLSLIQGMTAFGLVYISITTLEHRFNLDSFQSGFISSAYDVSALSVSLFVTYLGERGHKPRWIGIGSVIFSLGSVVFAVPHFMTGLYDAGESRDPLCHDFSDNATIMDSCNSSDGVESGLAVFYWVFILAQVLHGIGASPLYTLGVTYMDENLHAKDFGFYLGIFNAVNAAGPAIGYALGGVYLRIYTDFHVMDSALVSPNNPTWVGAWWLGFLINGSLLFVISLLMLGYPRALPGSREIASKRKSEVQRGQEFESGQGWKKRLQAFPRAVLNLITNIPFICVCFFAICEWFFASGLSVFGPKYLESQLNINSSDAAFYTGLLSMTGMVTGALIGGWIIKRFDLKFKGLIVFAIICTVGCLGASCTFLLKCPNVPMAGVTVPYLNSSDDLALHHNITAMCNKECNCERSFEPVCGSDNVLYYSACHAGCFEQSESNSVLQYADCSCIRNNTGPGLGTAKPGKCYIFCSSTRPFFLVTFLLLTFAGMVLVPVWTATIRCVPHSQRTFALGLQSLLYSALGTIPGPVVLGLLIDKSCLVWEGSCDGSKTCWLYENSDLSLVFFLITLLAHVIGLLFLVGALFSYRNPDGQDGADGKYDRLENDGITDGL
ncbi:solute carrier organic anion transporter family member 4A1-like [Lytechinus variegatus]|uniref:solute carrier organic anion transporter family member 4A1-like n=1 Tax=Lytechinus variegatus TaxID=7654 RepID=UPI001BB0D931|nr:solute carrier organic anion transporter family member 4A1-like [Lytechinus variegatus]